MAVSHKGAISFGLVHIPISLYTATQDSDIHFNQLHKEDQGRVRYKKVCAHCGKEIGAQDIVKGFEYDDDKYVVVTNEDFEKIKTEKDKTIQILHFADLSAIRPIFYDTTYHALPDAGGDKAFELLRTAMLEQNKVAIARTIMGTKDKLLALIPTQDGMLIETMFFIDEIKEIPRTYQKDVVKPEELEMAKMLITSMDKAFDPAAYHDEYQQRLREVIQQKIQGKEIVTPKQERVGNVIDLMEALKASVEQQTGKKPAPRTKAKKSKPA